MRIFEKKEKPNTNKWNLIFFCERRDLDLSIINRFKTEKVKKHEAQICLNRKETQQKDTTRLAKIKIRPCGRNSRFVDRNMIHQTKQKIKRVGCDRRRRTPPATGHENCLRSFFFFNTEFSLI